MAKKQKAVMDIGSSKIKVIVFSLASGNKFTVTGVGEVSYAGFSDGEFLEPENLKMALAMAISNAEAGTSFHIKELFVGLPAEFITCIKKTTTVKFPYNKKISQMDHSDLTDRANDLKYNMELTLIGCNSISFLLDNGKKVLNPIGFRTEKLTANLSYEYAENNCLNLLNSLFEQIGLISVNYLSAPLAEALYLLDEDTRADAAMFVDCGYTTTHVGIARGNGLLSLNCFSIGGAHVMSDLAQILKIDFAEAENLKKKVILSVTPRDEDNYEVSTRIGLYEVPATVVTKIVVARIEEIALCIDKCLQLSGVSYPKYYPIFLTGGGISMIKGVKEFLSKLLARPVEILTSDFPQFTKPYNSQIIALAMMVAQKYSVKKQHSIFAKLFKR